MRTTKLVLGILTIVISAFVVFQSCAAGIANSLSENGESSGTGGLLVAMIMLAGGIVMIASRKSESKGGSVAGLILFVLAALIGFSSAGSYKDLNVWAGLCTILAVVKRSKSKKNAGTDDTANQ